MEIILASNSPRRRELLQIITSHFKIAVSHVDETIDKHLLPQEVAMNLSQKKAEAIFQQHSNDLVIGADTIVFCEGEFLEKPMDNDDAYRMLKILSGKTHQVITGVSLISPNKKDIFYVSTDVTFYNLLEEEIYDYIDTKEPFDKAGGYGIQGHAAKFIKEIKGDYYSVMGLPIASIYQKLKLYNLH